MGHRRPILKLLAQWLIASASGIGIIGNVKVKRNKLLFSFAVPFWEQGTKGLLYHLQANKKPHSANVSFSHYRLGGRAAMVKGDQGYDR
jgi:hypothetical protein